jgi:hypothetical protein
VQVSNSWTLFLYRAEQRFGIGIDTAAIKDRDEDGGNADLDF